MPANKDFKRLVRTRMRKTGESYTTARMQLLNRKQSAIRPEPMAPAAAVLAPTDYGKIAGMSDAAVKAKTGCTWERWVTALDYHGADAWSHRAIAEFIHEKYKVPGWWTQMVTVGYERIKGLRARGQRRDGTYEATKSRTYNVPVTKLFDAWSDANLRKRWLDGAAVKVRTATAPKSIRLGWGDGTIVAVGFVSK